MWLPGAAAIAAHLVTRRCPGPAAVPCPALPCLRSSCAARMQECWPAGSYQAGDKAVQTPLADGGSRLEFAFPEAVCPARLVFVIKEGEQWTNSGGGDFVAHLKPPGKSGGAPPCRPWPASQPNPAICKSLPVPPSRGVAPTWWHASSTSSPMPLLGPFGNGSATC